MKRTLLEKATSHTRNRRSIPLTDEHVELSMAWLRDEVGLNQVALALQCSRQNAYQRLACILRTASLEGWVCISRVSPEGREAK